ncbi:MAG: metallophosphoesterase [Oscillospiraceae bacterium]|jgi:Icc-related predicted phosphoesterase|nr:metallophosphoesterase [Oscillospiraceae bacterium]
MKILIISDEESRFLWDFFDRDRLSDVELIISAGDLHVDYLSFLVTMMPVPLFYVRGNHDKRFANRPPLGCDSLEDTVRVFGGLRIGGLGGCMSGNPDGEFEFDERGMSKRVDKLLRKSHGKLDIFVSHAPAEGLGDGDDFFHKGFACYRRLLDKAKPQAHVYGHVHKSYGVEPPTSYNDTRLFNACGYKIIEI